MCLQYIAVSATITCYESTTKVRKADTERKRREHAKKEVPLDKYAQLV